MLEILAIDPGEHTGWVFYEDSQPLRAGTCPKNHKEVWEMLCTFRPGLVIVESFRMYPSKAQSLIWNSFYTVEVIGVIKIWCLINNVQLVEQAPAIKKYYGGIQDDWKDKTIIDKWPVTEHSKDAYMHLRYYLRNCNRKKHK